MRKSKKQGVCCLDRLSDVKKKRVAKTRKNVYIRNCRQEVGIMVLQITAIST